MREKLGTYVNGNTIVAIYDDGTKERYIKDGEDPDPEFPESIDLKITGYCDMGCPFCAEESSPYGSHAKILNNPLLQSIPPFTELAIGGGNPLSHPDLETFLIEMKKRQVICNMTVNVKHFMESKPILAAYQDTGLIHGLGISIPSEIPLGFLSHLKNLQFRNVVIHTIAGYTPMSTYYRLYDNDLNLLLLGFKSKGFGVGILRNDYRQISENTADLRNNLHEMRKHFKAIAFDNLAVNQLKLRKAMAPAKFNRLYMGDDGEFTMYVDMVTKTFGISSSHKTMPINSPSIADLFEEVRCSRNAQSNLE